MYPSSKMPYLGIFVRNIEEGLIKEDIYISKRITISLGDKNILLKVIDYIRFYYRIIFSGLFGKYDLIYGHYVSHIAIPLVIVNFFKPSKIVLNFHGSDIKNKSNLNSILHLFAKQITRKASLIIAPTNYFKKEVLKFSDINETSIYVSPSGGIDNIFYNNSIKEKTSTLTIGYVSRLDEQKGWFTFLNALEILKNYGVSFNVLAIGSSTPKSLEQISKQNLTNEIQYLGTIKHKKLPKFYNLMDLFIFPTNLEESLGLVGLEAMAGSVPVIASQIGGITDYLKDRTNGFFFKHGSAEDLSEKIINYIKLSESEQITFANGAYNTAMKYKHDIVSKGLSNQLKLLTKLIN